MNSKKEKTNKKSKKPVQKFKKPGTVTVKSKKQKKQGLEKKLKNVSLIPSYTSPSKAVVTIQATANALAFQQAPMVMASMAMTLGFIDNTDSDIYAAYLGIFEDIIAASSGTFTKCAQTRLQYQDDIIATLSPKNVPLGDGEVAYSWQGLPVNPASQVNVGSHVYYMPPTVPNEEQVSKNYTGLLNVLATYNSKPETTITERKPKTRYSSDVSAYARNAAYHGNIYSSVENEVYFRSGLMAAFTVYNETEDRSSNYLRVASTLPSLAFGYGLVRGVRISFYDNKIPLKIKCLDFDEFVYYCAYWYAALCTKYCEMYPGVDPASLILPFDLGQFMIILRQQLLSYFAEEQNLTQGFISQSVNNPFTSFLCGQNCFPKKISQAMSLPNVLIENLRMLKEYKMAYEGKFATERNFSHYIPTWGRYPENVIEEVNFTDSTGATHLILNSWDPYNGDLIDGSLNGSGFTNFNDGAIQANITFWEDNVQKMQQFSVPIMKIGGSSSRTFLNYTRTYEYVREQKITDKTIKFLPKSAYRIEKLKGHPDKYLPSGSSLAFFCNTNLLSNDPISQEFTQIENVFILPSVMVEPLIPESVSNSQIQTEYREPYKLYKEAEANFPSRLSIIAKNAANLAPGVAASMTNDLANFVSRMEQDSKGGFLGDLFGTVSNIANTIGI